MAGWAALVLAGGKASRFQSPSQPWTDKALAPVDGKPLLAHVVLNLQKAVEEVAVCVNNPQRQAKYSRILAQSGVENVKFVVDQNSVVQGPLLAIASGLKALNAEYCLTVPTDMPFLKPKVAAYLLDSVKNLDVAVPMWPDGSLETLVMALNREKALAVAEALLASKRAQADGVVRGAGRLQLLSPMQQIRLFDPGLRSFININSPLDLDKLETRGTEGAVKGDLFFDWGQLDVSVLQKLKSGLEALAAGDCAGAQKIFEECTEVFVARSQFFWAALSIEKLALATSEKKNYLRAAKFYRKEAEAYGAKNCQLLWERAQANAQWCSAKAQI